jgi:IS30 family transposase
MLSIGPLLATVRQQKRATATRIAASAWHRAEDCLRQEWSPEQVSGWLWREHQLSVSHERIYSEMSTMTSMSTMTGG